MPRGCCARSKSRTVRPGVLRVTVRPLEDVLVGDVRPVLIAFVAASALLLLVACANVGTLLVSRAFARQREFAVRLAIGASPLRLVRTSLLESLIITAAGTALGGVVAAYGLSTLAGVRLRRAAADGLRRPRLTRPGGRERRRAAGHPSGRGRARVRRSAIGLRPRVPTVVGQLDRRAGDDCDRCWSSRSSRSRSRCWSARACSPARCRTCSTAISASTRRAR